MIKDIHTHRLYGHPEESIFSYSMKDALPAAAVYISPGIHPWYLSGRDDLERQEQWLVGQLSDSRVLALGEAGLDKLCPCPMEWQVEAFGRVARLAEQTGLPLIIHCVKATGELIALKKDFRPSVPWIIHGFRGKKELAASLVGQGFYLSFGEKYHPEALEAVLSERLLFETDESTIPVGLLYERASVCRNCRVEELLEQVGSTTNRLFFNR